MFWFSNHQELSGYHYYTLCVNVHILAEGWTHIEWFVEYILELEHPRKTAKIPQIFSDFYYE